MVKGYSEAKRKSAQGMPNLGKMSDRELAEFTAGEFGFSALK